MTRQKTVIDNWQTWSGSHGQKVSFPIRQVACLDHLALTFFSCFLLRFIMFQVFNFFFCFVWFGLVLFRFFLRWSRCLSADTRYSARKRKRSGKNATSIMACQLSKPFVCCALELTSPTFSQPKPAAPPCPQFSAAFFIPILLWVHLFFFVLLGILILPERTFFFFWGESSWNGETERQHTIIEICRSPFSFFFLYIYFL